MTRLQKKCLIVTAGLHLTLIFILVFGTAFFAAKPKPDDTQVLDVIPANLIDAAFSSGVKSAQPPPPAPPQTKPVVTPPPPTPEPPKPVVPQPKPDVTPPTLVQKMENFFKPPPDKISPDADEPAKPKPHKVQVNLTPVVHKVPKITEPSAADAAAEAKEQKRIRDQQRKAFLAAASAIENNASSATKVEIKGTSSVSYASYASAVKSIYERAWRTPNDATDDDANTRVSVTIARDGSVISSRILTPSGDASVDRSVQQTLDRVTFIAPFPDGATENEKTFVITFNLKSKRMLG